MYVKVYWLLCAYDKGQNSSDFCFSIDFLIDNVNLPAQILLIGQFLFGWSNEKVDTENVW